MSEKVRVFSKPGCGRCVFTKRTLQDLGIEYEEKSVEGSKNKDNLHYIKENGYSDLPVVELPNGETFTGFQRDKLEKFAKEVE